MKVTVIVPIYNSAKFLDESIGSLLKQTYENLEILLVDNGSTDNSLDVCNRYADKDKRIRVIHTDENIGTGAARNLGLESATGEYVCFFDADDRYEPRFFEKLLSAATEKNADVVLCGYSGFREDGGTEPHSFGTEWFSDAKSVHKYVATWFPDGRVGFIGNKLYKTSVIKDNNLQFPKLSRLEDGFFNLDFFTYANSCVVVSDILYNYRLSPASTVIAKHNSEYADIVMTLTDSTFEARKKWNVEAPTDEVYKFYLNELGTSIENAFIGDWGMNAIERRSYLNQMTLMDTYIDAYKHLELIGTYRATLHKLLNSHKFILLGLLVRLKTFGKGNLQWIYYRLKK
ncbi:MAG: glycosyltransferase family 2 protein [Clostridia bacterium]|nr:glycosyltransferase family 2 protein [Clostridia bacterium]